MAEFPANQSRLQRYLAGIGTTYVRMFAQVAVALWLIPFTLRYLDREEYAIFSLVTDLIVWLGMLDLGITSGLRVQAARLTGQPDSASLNRLASTAFFAQNAIVVAVVALGIGVAFGLPHFFTIRPDLQREAVMTCVIVVFSTALSTATQTFSSLLVAHQQMHIDNLIHLLLIAIRTVLTVVLLHFGWGLYSLAVAHVTAKLVAGALAIVRVYRLLPDLKIRYSLVSWDTLRGTIGLGIWFTLGSMAGLLIEGFDSVIVAKQISLETVTSFSITRRLYDLAACLVLVLSNAACPMLGQMFGQNKTDEAFATYRRLTTVSIGLAVVVAMAVWSGNSCFVRQWAGAVNYAGYGVDLAVAFSVITVNWLLPHQSILSANLELRPQCLARVGEAVLKVGLAIVFGQVLGLVGIPLATLTATTLTTLWILPWLAARMFGRSPWMLVREEMFRVVVLLGILYPVAVGARKIAEHFGGFLGAMAGATLTGACGLILVWFLVLDRSVKERVPMPGWNWCFRIFGRVAVIGVCGFILVWYLVLHGRH